VRLRDLDGRFIYDADVEKGYSQSDSDSVEGAQGVVFQCPSCGVGKRAVSRRMARFLRGRALHPRVLRNPAARGRSSGGGRESAMARWRNVDRRSDAVAERRLHERRRLLVSRLGCERGGRVNGHPRLLARADRSDRFWLRRYRSNVVISPDGDRIERPGCPLPGHSYHDARTLFIESIALAEEAESDSLLKPKRRQSAVAARTAAAATPSPPMMIGNSSAADSTPARLTGKLSYASGAPAGAMWDASFGHDGDARAIRGPAPTASRSS
jgi:hypothetical protein